MTGKEIIDQAVAVLKQKDIRLTDSAILQQIEKMIFEVKKPNQ